MSALGLVLNVKVDKFAMLAHSRVIPYNNSIVEPLLTATPE